MEIDDEDDLTKQGNEATSGITESEVLRETLNRRLMSLRANGALATIPDAISTLDRRIAGMAEHVAILETEERALRPQDKRS